MLPETQYESRPDNGVVFAGNCSREWMKPDEDLVQRVKKAVKMEEDPKWYYLAQ
ncbi:hypothetical protein SCP_1501470 [Sparassis crispa]|uniref:Uncharacterized protein n=1 Tax=Sparassis crispa TaxID=139825 RepID=A0A401H415_9APHY|nr:hypothetical protein SCP_1501470 [Sparassis crispa]GBE89141.1 hypothetical protein SCP_1501470 [Sparassis crispa]